MQEQRLDGMRVAIVATDDFEQSELSEPRKALMDAGARPVIIAPKAGQIQGVQHDVKADSFPVDMTLDDARVDDFDALVLPGGALNADALRVNPKAQQFAREMDQSGRPIAVICHGPWLLISARLTQGRTMTSYHTIQDDIRNSGATWNDEELVRDRNWVSSRSPRDLPAFNRAMIQLFAEQKERRGQAGGQERRTTEAGQVAEESRFSGAQRQ